MCPGRPRRVRYTCLCFVVMGCVSCWPGAIGPMAASDEPRSTCEVARHGAGVHTSPQRLPWASCASLHRMGGYAPTLFVQDTGHTGDLVPREQEVKRSVPSAWGPQTANARRHRPACFTSFTRGGGVESEQRRLASVSSLTGGRHLSTAGARDIKGISSLASCGSKPTFGVVLSRGRNPQGV